MNYYRGLNFRTLFTHKYNHILLLLFWPFHSILFYLYERVLPLEFHPIESSLDSVIPFCEYFIIPYYGWYAYIVGILAYLFFVNRDEFRMYMNFIIISYSLTMVFYLIYPTEQNLRPIEFERDNVFVNIVQDLYATDTNTNVCPSLHVIGQMAAHFAAWRIRMRDKYKLAWRIFWTISTVAVCASTVCLKQHSIIDVYAGLAVSVVIYFVAYRLIPNMTRNRLQPQLEVEEAHECVSVK